MECMACSKRKESRQRSEGGGMVRRKLSTFTFTVLARL